LNFTDYADTHVITNYGIMDHRLTNPDAILTEDTDSFIIGETVFVGGVHRGKIAFIGETKFGKGEYAGVVLDNAIGKNDGTISGVRYFQCEANHGLFTRLTRLTRQSLIPTDPSQCEVHGQTPPRCLAEKQRSPSPFTSATQPTSPGSKTTTRLGSPAPPPKIGERVIIQSSTGTKRGILRFTGFTKFANGEWAGVELDQPIGKNDGSISGYRYFDCKEHFGLFAPMNKVTASPVNRLPGSNNSSLSQRYSREGSCESDYY